MIQLLIKFLIFSSDMITILLLKYFTEVLIIFISFIFFWAKVLTSLNMMNIFNKLFVIKLNASEDF